MIFPWIFWLGFLWAYYTGSHFLKDLPILDKTQEMIPWKCVPFVIRPSQAHLFLFPPRMSVLNHLLNDIVIEYRQMFASSIEKFLLLFSLWNNEVRSLIGLIWLRANIVYKHFIYPLHFLTKDSTRRVVLTVS